MSEPTVTIEQLPPVALPIDADLTFIEVETAVGGQQASRRMTVNQISATAAGLIIGTSVDNPAAPGGTFDGLLQFQNSLSQDTAHLGFLPAGDVLILQNLVEGGELSLRVRDGSVRLVTQSYGVEIPTTGALRLPVGTVAQQPTPLNGQLRYNSDDNVFEGVASGVWGPISGGAVTLALDDLTDVTLAAPATGSLLYKSAGDWLNTNAISVDPTGSVTLRFNGRVVATTQNISGTDDTLQSTRLRLTATNDADLASTLHAVQIGDTAGQNLIFDTNEIMVRDGGAAARLNINIDGGDVAIGSSSGMRISLLNASNVSILHAGDEIFQSTTPALGGVLVDNQATGAGLERVLTVSDLAGGGGNIDDGTVLNSLATWNGVDTWTPLSQVTMAWVAGIMTLQVLNDAAALVPVLDFDADGDYRFLLSSASGRVFFRDTINDREVQINRSSVGAFTGGVGSLLFLAFTGGGVRVGGGAGGLASDLEVFRDANNAVESRVYNTSGGIEFQVVAGGNANINQVSSTGVGQDVWINFARDGAVTLRNNNINRIQATATGLAAFGLTHEFSTTSASAINHTMRNSAAGINLTVGAGGNALIRQTSNAGVTQDTWLTLTRDGPVTLHHNTIAALRSADRTASDIGTGGEVTDGLGVFRPVGFNVMPIFEQDASDSFDLDHNGFLWHKDAGAAVTYTCANDATIPIGATYTVTNEDTEVLTIAEGGGVTLRWFDGGGAVPPTGNRSLAQGGVATVFKYTDTEFFIWGAGIS